MRELQRQLREQGVEFANEADEAASGPASFMLVDPTATRCWSISTSELSA